MKYQIKFLIALLIIVSTYSCTDFEDVQVSPTESQAMSDPEGIQVMEYSGPVSFSKGLSFGNTNTTFLSFPSLHVFKITITLLEARTAYHDDQFIANNSNLNNEQLSEKEREMRFNPYEPLEQFSSNYNFDDSMLRDYIDAENNWLGKRVLDINNDPDDYFFDLEEEQLAVLNRDGVVKIGNSLFKIFDGGYFEITDGNLKTLTKLIENRIDPCVEELSIQEYPNVNVVSSCGGGGGGDDNSNTCLPSTTRSNNHWVLDGDRMLKGKVSLVNSALWGEKIKSKTKYFKKGFLGIWYRRRSHLVAALDGKFDDGATECGNFAFTFDEKIDRAEVQHKSKAKYLFGPVNRDLQDILIQPGKVTGFHYENSNLRKVILK